MNTSSTSAPLQPAIVVTGASSGIGREIARVASRDGCFMLLIGRSRQSLDALAAELQATGAQAEALSLDLTDRDAGERIEAILTERGLYCDVLVNSAGFGLFEPRPKSIASSRCASSTPMPGR